MLSGHGVYRTMLHQLMALAARVAWIPVGGWGLRAVVFARRTRAGGRRSRSSRTPGTVTSRPTIERAVVMQGAEIGRNCTLSGCIVGGGVRIGDDCQIDGMSVLGEGVTIGSGNVVSNGARVFPGVSLPDGALLF